MSNGSQESFWQILKCVVAMGAIVTKDVLDNSVVGPAKYIMSFREQEGRYKVSTFLLIHMHWNNRGDEAANRALIEQIKMKYPDAEIYVQLCAYTRYGTEELEEEGIHFLDSLFPRHRHFLEYLLVYFTKGRCVITKAGKEFLEILKKSDIVIHCPGGPSIGDIYINAEKNYLERLLLACKFKKKFFLYAPSAGPFRNAKRNKYRAKIFKGATKIIFREAMSGQYLQDFLPDVKYSVSVDTAFLNKIDMLENQKLLVSDIELNTFLECHSKIVGITITDLVWNPLYQNDFGLKEHIEETFRKFIAFILSKGYAVLFIPQLFGEQNDYDYMKNFEQEGCFTVRDIYNCNFQQYLISRLYAVVGMRYHSNIFSCKMGTPFISVSYEQKMKGFMNTAGLDKWCIDIRNLEADALSDKFSTLELEYSDYKNAVEMVSVEMYQKAEETFEILTKCFI